MKEVRPLALVLALSPAACTSEGSGNVQVFVVPEDSITHGLVPGTDPENVHDGFTVTYRRFLVSIGRFRADRSDEGDRIADPGTYVLDLVHAPTNGYVVHEFRDVAAVRWDRFGYDLPPAAPDARALPPTTAADAAFMSSNGYSIYYEGEATKGALAISFRWGFASGTSFGDCMSSDGIPGFAVPDGGTVSIKPTIHGDHQFFDNVTQGVENTQRLVQWVDTCDADRDGELTLAELRGCDVVLALPQPPYDLTGVADQDGDGRLSVYDFVASEMKTIGDFQGDGECPTRTAVR